jgi:hypothetical protein
MTARRLRFSLRTLFVAMTVLSCGAGWAAYQLHWIRERHAFLEREHIVTYPLVHAERPLPWSLRLFGESQQFLLGVPYEDLDRARDLFPEAILNLAYPPSALASPYAQPLP